MFFFFVRYGLVWAGCGAGVVGVFYLFVCFWGLVPFLLFCGVFGCLVVSGVWRFFWGCVGWFVCCCGLVRFSLVVGVFDFRGCGLYCLFYF